MFMDESSSQKLLMQLVSARSESEASKIIDSDPLTRRGVN